MSTGGWWASPRAGGRIVNGDRMWHYVEGVRNWDPVWAQHGIRIIPGPSSVWLDGAGDRLPAPLYPGFDTLGTLEYLRQSGFDHSWFVLNQRIIEKEFVLSGSEQNLDLTNRSVRDVIGRARGGVPASVQAFLDHGEDFVVAPTVRELVAGMNALVPEAPLDPDKVERILRERDLQVDNEFGKDFQIMAIRAARAFRGDRMTRTVPPHPILDPAAGPLIAVRLSVLTRKTLGGVQTDLAGRVLRMDGTAVPALYAAGGCRPAAVGCMVPGVGGHLPRRVPVFRASCRAVGGDGAGLSAEVGGRRSAAPQ